MYVFFRFQWSDGVCTYIADHVFSQLFIATAVALAARSLWNIFDDVLLPNDGVTSNLVSWGSGFALAAVMLAIEPLTTKASHQLEKKHKSNES